MCGRKRKRLKTAEQLIKDKPTFDPAKGKDDYNGGILHSRMLPAHTKLKYRRKGQGGDADKFERDYAAELLLKEQVNEGKNEGKTELQDRTLLLTNESSSGPTIEEINRRKQILAQYRDVDADSESESHEGGGGNRQQLQGPETERGKEREEDGDGNESDNEYDSDSESEDERELLMRELEKIKQERAEQERQAAEKEMEKRQREVAFGNPLMNGDQFKVQKSWTEDTVFRDQAKRRKVETNGNAINDLLRSDFHRRFLNKANLISLLFDVTHSLVEYLNFTFCFYLLLLLVVICFPFSIFHERDPSHQNRRQVYRQLPDFLPAHYDNLLVLDLRQTLREWKNSVNSGARETHRRSSGSITEFPRAKPLPIPRNIEDEAKLIFGVVFSLRNMVRKLTDEDSFQVYTTSKYRLHYFEPPSNIKFVLITDPKVENMVNVLRQIYVSLYVEYVVKNPLSPVEHAGGEGVNNQLFVLGLDAFMSSLPYFD